MSTKRVCTYFAMWRLLERKCLLKSYNLGLTPRSTKLLLEVLPHSFHMSCTGTLLLFNFQLYSSKCLKFCQSNRTLCELSLFLQDRSDLLSMLTPKRSTSSHSAATTSPKSIRFQQFTKMRRRKRKLRRQLHPTTRHSRANTRKHRIQVQALSSWRDSPPVVIVKFELKFQKEVEFPIWFRCFADPIMLPEVHQQRQFRLWSHHNFQSYNANEHRRAIHSFQDQVHVVQSLTRLHPAHRNLQRYMQHSGRCLKLNYVKVRTKSN